MMQITEVVKHLLIINVLMFIAGEIVNLDWLALHFPSSEKFMPLQIATHFFMHGGLMHLFFNMFALWMFGTALERIWGPKRFLIFYFVCAFGAFLLHFAYTYYSLSGMESAALAFAEMPNLANYNYFVNEHMSIKINPEVLDQMDVIKNRLFEQSASASDVQYINQIFDQYIGLNKDIPIVGASGAIYGLLLAFGMRFPNVELMLIFLPIPIKAKYFIPALMLIELFMGFNQFSWDNIAHFAHLGGALVGFLLVKYWEKFP